MSDDAGDRSSVGAAGSAGGSRRRAARWSAAPYTSIRASRCGGRFRGRENESTGTRRTSQPRSPRSEPWNADSPRAGPEGSGPGAFEGRGQATTEQALTVRCRCGAEPGAWCLVSKRRKLVVCVGFVHTRRRFAFTRRTGAGGTQLALPRASGA